MSSVRSRPRRVAGSSLPKNQQPGGDGNPSDPGSATGLRLQERPERLSSLLREHQQLLTKIKQKRRELQRLTERMQTTLAEASRRVAPLLAEIERLDGELHALFSELLARKRQPRGVTAAVKRIYQTLQQAGVLSPAAPAPAPTYEDRARASAGRWESAAADGEPEAGGYSAPRPGAREGTAGQSLRGLFHRLAAEVHPDRAQHEDEKARRTEAMKELTRAYQDGDLARLLELEKIWLVAGELPAARDELSDLDDRCATLGRTNAALRSQLDQIKKELKELRRSPQAVLLSDLARSAARTGEDQFASAITEAQEHVDHLRELVDFIGKFRAGAIDLDELLAGPPSTRDQALDDDLDLEDFDALLRDALKQQRSPRGKARRRAGRTGPPGDIPF
ncbi:MAG TPA: hypothetical protein PLW65_04060 [Pseudomonadota bacterium]|nr:hypothetical protein [Pseudomonadota bacterium]